jgi:hypothetical protein
MAPVKPMGMGTTTPPKGSKPGVTGFVQEYNDQPSPAQDLNPDAVTSDSELPAPQTLASRENAPKAKRTRKAAK